MKRYELGEEYDYPCMRPVGGGDWVDYDDAQKLIVAMREILRMSSTSSHANASMTCNAVACIASNTLCDLGEL